MTEEELIGKYPERPPDKPRLSQAWLKESGVLVILVS